MTNGNLQLSISAGAVIALIGLNIKMIWNARKELRDEMNQKVKDVVYEDTCKATQEGIKTEIKGLEKHLGEKIDYVREDIKLFIKNGNK